MLIKKKKPAKNFFSDKMLPTSGRVETVRNNIISKPLRETPFILATFYSYYFIPSHYGRTYSVRISDIDRNTDSVRGRCCWGDGFLPVSPDVTISSVFHVMFYCKRRTRRNNSMHSNETRLAYLLTHARRQ